MTPDRLWKQVEREHSRLLGGHGRTGPQGKGLPDVKHAWLAIESKERATPIAAMENAMLQAKVNSLALDDLDNTLPVTIWHWRGQPYGMDIVCMRLQDFIDWFGG